MKGPLKEIIPPSSIADANLRASIIHDYSSMEKFVDLNINAIVAFDNKFNGHSAVKRRTTRTRYFQLLEAYRKAYESGRMKRTNNECFYIVSDQICREIGVNSETLAGMKKALEKAHILKRDGDYYHNINSGLCEGWRFCKGFSKFITEVKLEDTNIYNREGSFYFKDNEHEREARKSLHTKGGKFDDVKYVRSSSQAQSIIRGNVDVTKSVSHRPYKNHPNEINPVEYGFAHGLTRENKNLLFDRAYGQRAVQLDIKAANFTAAINILKDDGYDANGLDEVYDPWTKLADTVNCSRAEMKEVAVMTLNNPKCLKHENTNLLLRAVKELVPEATYCAFKAKIDTGIFFIELNNLITSKINEIKNVLDNNGFIIDTNYDCLVIPQAALSTIKDLFNSDEWDDRFSWDVTLLNEETLQPMEVSLDDLCNNIKNSISKYQIASSNIIYNIISELCGYKKVSCYNNSNSYYLYISYIHQIPEEISSSSSVTSTGPPDVGKSWSVPAEDRLKKKRMLNSLRG